MVPEVAQEGLDWLRVTARVDGYKPVPRPNPGLGEVVFIGVDIREIPLAQDFLEGSVIVSAPAVECAA